MNQGNFSLLKVDYSLFLFHNTFYPDHQLWRLSEKGVQMKFKKWLAFALCALLGAGCTSSQPSSSLSSIPSKSQEESTTQKTPTTDAEFSAFLDRFVLEQCQSDYTTCHSYFENPQAYGIDPSKCDVTLGTFFTDPEEVKELQSWLDELLAMDDSDLSKINRQIRQAFIREFELSLELCDEKYEYLGNIWSSDDGIPSLLVTYFSEYRLYSADDVSYLVELLKDVPRFVEEGLEFTQKQIEAKTFSIDMDEALETCQSVLKNQSDSAVTNELFAEVDGLVLSEEETKKAKEAIEEALNQSFFPAYETMISGLQAVKKQNKALVGLGSFENGKAYYELLLKSQVGTDETIEELREEIKRAMNDTTDAYRRLLRNNEEAILEAEDPQTSFTTIEEIMPFLEERYPAKFPVVEAMNYEIKPLSNEQSTDGIVAYFVRPCVDSTRPYEIRYNVRDYGDDPASLMMYDTFAHEGIPGHMYQAQYNKEHYVHIAQYFLDNLSFTEGYATYAANSALDWVHLDKDVLEAYRLMEFYPQYNVLLMDLQINYDGYSKRQFRDVWGEGYEAIYDQLAQNPGVFFSYYYGSLKIMELQAIAQEALGNDYDDVAFNNALLQAGDVDFSIIEENIQDYIDSIRTGKYTDEKISSRSSKPSTSKSNKKVVSSEDKASEKSESTTEDDILNVEDLDSLDMEAMNEE